MKTILFWILTLVLAVGLYIPCRSFAVSEREGKGIDSAGVYGGEVLLPVMVVLGAMCLSVEEGREKE